MKAQSIQKIANVLMMRKNAKLFPDVMINAKMHVGRDASVERARIEMVHLEVRLRMHLTQNLTSHGNGYLTAGLDADKHQDILRAASCLAQQGNLGALTTPQVLLAIRWLVNFDYLDPDYFQECYGVSEEAINMFLEATVDGTLNELEKELS